MAELLAVIARLGVVALIVFPAVNKTIKNSKEKAYNQQVESILRSAENWTTENMSSLSDTSDNYITVEELRRSGFLESKKVINPITDEEMNGCIIINYDFSHNQYVYQYNDESCDDIQTVPVITLNGDATITINKGETFVDPGFSATYKGQDITSSVTVTGSVDTSVADTYTLTYNVSYNGKSAETITRIVHVVIEYRTFREVMEPLLGSAVNNNDPGQNLRYVGSDPDNYVWFNEELWRVIGVFDGQAKIIRDSCYGDGIWEESHDEGTPHPNNWETSYVKDSFITFLGEIQNNNSISYSYIDLNHVWNMGGPQSSYTTIPSRLGFYNSERSETISSEMTNYLWSGAIALIYPSDYGYASSGSTETCDSAVLSDWDTEPAKAECAEKSWLLSSQWTMTANTGSSNYIFTIQNSGAVSYDGYDGSSYTYPFNCSRPVLFLKSDIKIVDGKGTSDEPYMLSME